MVEQDIELLKGTALHTRVIQEAVLSAQRYVWIATANLKDVQVAMARGRFQPLLAVFDRLARSGVTFRVIHSEIPSRSFRKTLERFPLLTGGSLELQICPRSHWKMVIVDGVYSYCGSANFTGAGLGAKADNRRNFELGVVTKDPSWVSTLQEWFDLFWLGSECTRCAYRKTCPDPIVP
jgi:phosphatidylserine/phosphatidylglycerophosphate/cardiolipin synthase-like enzyme